ncbi:lycopene beta-cyclase CrtY [Altererythrobacter sp. MF3-039]|uniref:lycopene beta-cyclase CrtY n=1 Tax=Altererythrobacter sp. MF3-039 TaxID=3252901 RepID=UPI00390C5DFB
MSGRTYDLIIVGGGLAGGLTALAARRQAPLLDILLLEAGKVLGGHHRWSWFDSDLSEAGRKLMSSFSAKRWEGGYDVHFPAHSRHLRGTYNSLKSQDFSAAIHTALPEDACRTGASVTALDESSVTLEDGKQISAKAVLDCRNFLPSPHLSGGWQLFCGQTWRMAKPHGVKHPVIMDADLDQYGAYRFMYLLPLSETELFLEDTYYANTPRLDRDVLADRIASYVERHGWKGQVIDEEQGILPVITHGDFDAARASVCQPNVAVAGARALFTHPLTSYTLPIAVANALAIANGLPMNGNELAEMMENRAAAHWRLTGFYRNLGRMLFDAAEPDLRFRIFERFYRLPEGLIERFYAGRSTLTDQMRVLSGKPPVPVFAAMRALAGSGTPLVSGDSR